MTSGYGPALTDKGREKLHYIYNESLVFAVMFQLNIIIYS